MTLVVNLGYLDVVTQTFDLLRSLRRASGTHEVINELKAWQNRARSSSSPAWTDSKAFRRRLKHDDEAVLTLLYLALRNIAKKWTMPVTNWKVVLNRFANVYQNRLPTD